MANTVQIEWLVIWNAVKFHSWSRLECYLQQDHQAVVDHGVKQTRRWAGHLQQTQDY